MDRRHRTLARLRTRGSGRRTALPSFRYGAARKGSRRAAGARAGLRQSGACLATDPRGTLGSEPHRAGRAPTVFSDVPERIMGFNTVMALGALAIVALVAVAFFWPGILYYAALALAILWFPLIIAMCTGFGIQGDDEEEDHA
jgi:hypothetical protein